jgi:alginate O-acetyltransferase complex protein AlgI
VLFNSAQFAIFFPIVTLLYVLTPPRFGWTTLLVASCVFYMAFIPAYIVILGGTIVVDFFAARVIEHAHGATRRLALVASIVANIGVLAVFKYFNFIATSVTDVSSWLGINISVPLLAIALPIGLSFHTFQALAYTVEVYRGHQQAERHFGVYALYVMFYPQLVAGPIERPQNLLPQLHHLQPLEAHHVADGLKRMAWGLFKKVVIADRLALTVNAAYAHPAAVSGPALLLATFFFAWQIYCDFSGYSDIALGAAEVMGVRLMMNFRQPYLAHTTREFWTRWHISLSTWFRDYVYVPLGGSRGSQAQWVLALMVTFLLSGLWHGANWTFVVWGGLNGSFILIGSLTAETRAAFRAKLDLDRQPALLGLLQRLTTFALLSLGWIFFRAASVTDAFTILRRFTSTDGATLTELGLTGTQISLSLAVIVLLLTVETFLGDRDPVHASSCAPDWARWSIYYTVIVLTIVIGVFNESRFIYFQF